jgi:hypothetical protein
MKSANIRESPAVAAKIVPKASKASLAARDGVAPKEGLHDGFDEATQDDQPHNRVAHLRAQCRGGDQLARADDRRRHHDAGADLLQDVPETSRGLQHIRRIELVRIEVRAQLNELAGRCGRGAHPLLPENSVVGTRGGAAEARRQSGVPMNERDQS